MANFVGFMWKGLKFVFSWSVVSLGSLAFTIDHEIWLFQQWWYYALVGIISFAWAFDTRSRVDLAKGKKGITELGDLWNVVLLSSKSGSEIIRVAKVRQSGNEDSVNLFDDRGEALREIIGTFQRKRVDRVRIWKNTTTELDVRINFYHGRGANEGRVIRGIKASVVKVEP